MSFTFFEKLSNSQFVLIGIFAIIGCTFSWILLVCIRMLQRVRVLSPKLAPIYFPNRQIHVSPICERVQAARYKITPKRDRPLTYEMANPPHFIAHRKAWNSWNVCKWKGLCDDSIKFYNIFFVLHSESERWTSIIWNNNWRHFYSEIYDWNISFTRLFRGDY